jgi:hypothetical protein
MNYLKTNSQGETFVDMPTQQNKSILHHKNICIKIVIGIQI